MPPLPKKLCPQSLGKDECFDLNSFTQVASTFGRLLNLIRYILRDESYSIVHPQMEWKTYP